MTLLVAVLAPAVMVEEVESNVTGWDTDSMPDSYSRPLARQGAVTAALRLFRDEVCGREEWTGEEKADNIKSQGQDVANLIDRGELKRTRAVCLR